MAKRMARAGGISGGALAAMRGRERCGRKRDTRERGIAIRGRGIVFYYVVGPRGKVKHVLNTRVKKKI